ncbi:MAG: ribosomal protein S18-alanine N-acetyltransferase [Deltaproteobacteria bacterium]|nr:ribosomal protein S18-alanine N-acetyltransferase [Deltaproteobacteria bacterium]
MVRSDLSQVILIEKDSFALPYSESLFQMELNLSIAHLYAAKQGERIVGYIDFWHVTDEIHLINTAVHPGDRRRGIGSLLISFLIDYAKRVKARQIYLDVRRSNAPAIGLYKKFGFDQVGLRKGYYRDNNEDALVMGFNLYFSSNVGQKASAARDKG